MSGTITTSDNTLSDDVGSLTSSTCSTPSRKRKRAAVEAHHAALSTVEEFLDGREYQIPPAFKDSLEDLIADSDLLASSRNLKPGAPAQPASFMGFIEATVDFFNLEHIPGDSKYVWEIPIDGPPISLSPETGRVIKRSLLKESVYGNSPWYLTKRPPKRKWYGSSQRISTGLWQRCTLLAKEMSYRM